MNDTLDDNNPEGKNKIMRFIRVGFWRDLKMFAYLTRCFESSFGLLGGSHEQWQMDPLFDVHVSQISTVLSRLNVRHTNGRPHWQKIGDCPREDGHASGGAMPGMAPLLG